MNAIQTAELSLKPRLLLALLACLVASVLLASVANGQIDGFTDPFRKVELSSDESGSISKLNVEQGDFVDADSVIALLDTRVQELQLEIATQMAKNTSQLDAARESLKKRKLITQRLRELEKTGHARPSELIRAEMELAIAEAKYLAAQEEAIVHEIEQRRAEAMLDRRAIKAPFAGVIAKVHRREGEFLSPLRPELATLVQIDRLLATFMIPSSQIRQFQPGKKFQIELEDGTLVEGLVYQIGVETDAQSGTVEVKLVIENPMNEYRSGEICSLSI